MSEFNSGRYYQLIIDRYGLTVDKILKKLKRSGLKPDALSMETKRLNSLSMMDKVKLIIETFIAPPNDCFNFEFYDASFQSYEAGRCFQYLLDANQKIYNTEVLREMTTYELIETAYKHYMKYIIDKKINASKTKMEGNKYVIKHNCSCCDYGTCIWSVGSKRCDCGNHRYFLEYQLLDKGLDTSIWFYPERD